MKKLFFIFLSITFFIDSFAQEQSVHTIKNVSVNTSNSTFSFDIYSRSTGGSSIHVGITSYYFTYNSSALNTPSLLNVNSSYNSGDYSSMSVDIIAGEIAVTIHFNSGTGVVLSTTSPDGERICTVQMNISNTAMNANLAWDETNSGMADANATNPISNSYNGSYNGLLPVELSFFKAVKNLNSINLNWKTATEVNNNGFEVQREVRDQKSEAGSQWENLGFLQGHGNSNSPKEYSFTDKNLTGGTNFVYRLKQIDNDGQYQYSKEVEVEVVPTQFAIYQNYPNPFNPETNIKFDLPEASKVRINVYNILGEKVAELLNKTVEPGFHQVEFNGSNLSSGTYIYRIEAQSSGQTFVQTKKMLMLK